MQAGNGSTCRQATAAAAHNGLCSGNRTALTCSWHQDPQGIPAACRGTGPPAGEVQPEGGSRSLTRFFSSSSSFCLCFRRLRRAGENHRHSAASRAPRCTPTGRAAGGGSGPARGGGPPPVLGGQPAWGATSIKALHGFMTPHRGASHPNTAAVQGHWPSQPAAGLRLAWNGVFLAFT